MGGVGNKQIGYMNLRCDKYLLLGHIRRKYQWRWRCSKDHLTSFAMTWPDTQYRFSHICLAKLYDEGDRHQPSSCASLCPNMTRCITSISNTSLAQLRTIGNTSNCTKFPVTFFFLVQTPPCMRFRLCTRGEANEMMQRGEKMCDN
jgi:hypothetical protein